MLTQDDITKAILDAKKEVSREQLIKTLKQCSYGGEPVNMVHVGGFVDKPFRLPDCGGGPGARIFHEHVGALQELTTDYLVKGGDEKHGKTDRSPTGED